MGTGCCLLRGTRGTLVAPPKNTLCRQASPSHLLPRSSQLYPLPFAAHTRSRRVQRRTYKLCTACPRSGQWLSPADALLLYAVYTQNTRGHQRNLHAAREKCVRGYISVMMELFIDVKTTLSASSSQQSIPGKRLMADHKQAASACVVH